MVFTVLSCVVAMTTTIAADADSGNLKFICARAFAARVFGGATKVMVVFCSSCSANTAPNTATTPQKPRTAHLPQPPKNAA